MLKKSIRIVMLLGLFVLMTSVALADDSQNVSRGGITDVTAPLADNGGATEGFDDITTLTGGGWAMINNSNPLGTTDWFQGNDTVFSAHAGATTAYIAANFNNTAGNTISNWLLTPETEIQTGDQFSFWTRTTTGNTFPDRMEVRLSVNGASTDVGVTNTSVGDFTTLLLEINPTLTTGGYPDDWAEYVITVTGVDTPTMGRIGFRYFVTDAGPVGINSNYIGIDTYTYIDFVPTDVSLTSFGQQEGGFAPTILLVLLPVLLAGVYIMRRRQLNLTD